MTTMTRYFAEQSSPVGRLRLVADDEGLRRIDFLNKSVGPADEAWREDTKRLRAPLEQLAAYFAGELREFDLALAPEGTEFRRGVWQALLGIAYGETISYGELARRIGNPKASRAVGLANGCNPLPIVIPCHRVIGADGSLTGYGGGLPIKRKLLALESPQRSLMG